MVDPAVAPDRVVPRRVRALGFRDFRWFFSANCISVSGGFMQLAGINWIVTEVTDSGSRIALVAVASMVPFMAFSPLGGALTDRYERRHLLLMVTWAQTGLAIAMAIAHGAGQLGYWMLVAFALVGGAFNGINAPVQQAIVPELVDKESLRSAAVLNSTSFTIARAVGPALAGVMIEVWGAGVTFWANAASFAAVIVVLMKAARRPPPARTGTAKFWSEFRGGLRFVRGAPGVKAALTLGALLALSGGVFQTPFTALVARRSFGADAGDYGLMQGVFGAGSVVTALVMIAFDPGYSHRRLAVLAVVSLGSGTVGVGVAPSFGWGLVAISIVGMGLMLATSTVWSALQAQTPDQYLGRVMAIFMMMFTGIVPVAVQVQGYGRCGVDRRCVGRHRRSRTPPGGVLRAQLRPPRRSHSLTSGHVAVRAAGSWRNHSARHP